MYIHKVLLFKKKKMCFLVDTICAKYYLDQDLSPIQSQQSESDIYAYNSVSVGVGGCVRACVRVCVCVCVCSGFFSARRYRRAQELITVHSP